MMESMFPEFDEEAGFPAPVLPDAIESVSVGVIRCAPRPVGALKVPRLGCPGTSGAQPARVGAQGTDSPVSDWNDVVTSAALEAVVPTLPVLSRAGADARDIHALTAHVFSSTGESTARGRDVLLEFFQSTLTNVNTRSAYLAAVTRFASWCKAHGLADVRAAKPHHLGQFLSDLEGDGLAITTRKQMLAALRMFYVALCQAQLLDHNPAAGVRSPRHSRRRGTTPVVSEDEMRALLAGVPSDSLRGLRDRALILLLFHTFARVSAAVGLTRENVLRHSGRAWVRVTEKGGKVLEVPLHRQLEAALFAYLEAAKIEEGPVFRSFEGRTGRLGQAALTRSGAFGVVRAYAQAAGIEAAVGCHSFRASGITSYLQRGGSLENAQRLAGHATPTTTKLYDRTGDEVTVAEVERLPTL